jgi:parallel beta-helix repeat protein
MLATRIRRGLAVVSLALAAALVAAVLAPHGSAGSSVRKAKVRATAVACGATITANTTLANDLSCTGNGIEMLGGIVLNLNGHTIDGAGFKGVIVHGPRTSATVENGTIRGFNEGIDAEGDSAKLLNLRISAGSIGVLLNGTGDVVSGSTIFDNESQGILANGTKAQILNDAVRDNGLSGVQIEGANATLTGNRAVSNAQDGILIRAAGAKLTSNTANGNSNDGIRFTVEIATVTKNIAFFNTKLGIEAQGGVTDSGGNRADENGSAHQCTDVVCS